MTFKQNSSSGSPIINTISDIINAINDDTSVGARASLNNSGDLTIVDPQGRGNITVSGITVSGSLTGATLGQFTSTSPNLQVSTSTGLTTTTALSDTEILVLTPGGGGAAVNFTVNAAVGPIKTIGDLITQINGNAALGVKASLDALGRLNLQAAGLTLAGTLTTSMSLGSFSNVSPALYGAGNPILLTKGSDGLNPNMLVSTTSESAIQPGWHPPDV